VSTNIPTSPVDVRSGAPGTTLTPVIPAPAGCAGECACAVEPLAHPKYSFGMLLEPRLLALEHRYHALRANTHDIRLHDFGTVCGLRVEKHPSPQCVNSYAILRPGIALDCCGREIVVPSDLFVPLKDGATSGWCGATMGTLGTTATTPSSPTQSTLTQSIPTKLYVCLRYAQCETDPIPTYVRPCGCCGPCEHGGCTPSVTREGYEVVVTSTPPPVWINPVGRAFCEWLDVKLTGPGSSAPAQKLYNASLAEVLSDVITQPCANFCDGGNELLLLATVSFNADGTLDEIDNASGRRLVLSTGALFEALLCLTKAEIVCCAATDAYLSLTAMVAPATVNLAALPAGNALAYTLTATNTDAHKTSESFELELAFPSGKQLTFSSATLTIAGVAAAAPKGKTAGVIAVIPSLAAGQTAVLVVNATFDPTAFQVGSTIVCTASIDDYVGGHDPDVSLTVAFIDQVTDGPRVVTKDLVQQTSDEQLTGMLAKGIALPFTEAMDPASAVATTLGESGAITQGTVTLVLKFGALTYVPAPMTWPCTLAWNATNDQLTVISAQPIPPSTTGEFLESATITLTAGPKGGVYTGPALCDAAKTARLDGSPSFGAGTDKPGLSGNGTQGGDFVYTITGSH